jgi:hypothetical protein
MNPLRLEPINNDPYAPEPLKHWRLTALPVRLLFKGIDGDIAVILDLLICD